MRRELVLGGIVALLAAIAFVPALGGEFIFDDRRLIAENANVHSFSGWASWFTGAFGSGGELPRQGERLSYYRPLVSASYALDWALGGGSPLAFHASNLVWHAAASMLAFLALLRWLGSAPLALAGALVFALHPTKAESAAWISGRADSMCAVWMLLAARGAAWRFAGRRRSGVALELVASLAAYLTKESAVVLPALIAVEAWVVHGRRALDARELFHMLRASGPELAAAFVYLAARQYWLPVHPGERWILPLVTRVGLVFETLGRAFDSSFLPRDLRVQHLLGRTPGGAIAVAPRFAALGAAGLAIAALAIFSLRRRLPALSLGLGLFLLTLAPTLNLVPLRQPVAIADRFLYLPLLGLALAFAAALRGPRFRGVSIGLVSGVAGALFVISAVRAADHASERRFWQHEARVNPASFEAPLRLLRLSLASGRRQEAARRYHEARAASVLSFVPTRRAGELLVEEVVFRAELTPDLDRTALGRIDAFLAELVRTPSALVLAPVDGEPNLLDLRDPRLHAVVVDRRPWLLAVRADIASRLGFDKRAAGMAERAARACRACPEVLARAALAAARAGKYELARALLDGEPRAEGTGVLRMRVVDSERFARAAELASGPARVLSQANSLASALAYGRAYALLAPHSADFEPNREVSLRFAELAFRAGASDVARAALAPHVERSEIERLIRAWSIKMGWSDPH
jgi:protein O-mannosyl-transferase